MNWVGILYINKSKFYLNGRLIASTIKDFHNICCFRKLPQKMLVFTTVALGQKEPLWLQQMNQFFSSIIYYQFKSYLYVHRQRKKYWLSVTIGFFAGVLSVLIQTSYLPTLNLKQVKVISFSQVQLVSLKIRKICGSHPCINRLTIFPDCFFIELNHVKDRSGCKKLKKGVFKCSNDS